MERLTERFLNGQAAVYGCGTNCKYDYKYCNNDLENCPTIVDVLEKLAEYEDTGLMPEQIEAMKGFANTVGNELAEYKELEEQGLLLKLPVKVGQTVWYMAREILQCKVRAVVSSFYDEAEIYLKYDGENDLLEHWNTFVGMDEIGKTVFLTRTEAEQALERMEKEK